MIQPEYNKQLFSNYYPVQFHKESVIATYIVQLTPSLDHSTLEADERRLLEKELLRHCTNKEGLFLKDNPQFLFLNFNMYVPAKQNQDQQYDCGQISHKDTIHEFKLSKKCDIEYDTEEAKQILGRLMKKAIGKCKLERIGRKFFDPATMKSFNQFKLGIVQGYESNLLQAEKLLLQVQPCIKSVRQETYLDVLLNIGQNNEEQIIGLSGGIVMTNYQAKKFYRVNRICTDMTPESTFTKKDKSQISYMQYYQQVYGITIRNRNQPLIEAVVKRRGKEQTLFLIPELCCPTGETDQMKADFRLQKEISFVKQAKAPEKMKQAADFVKRLQQESQKTFNEWNITLKIDPLNLQMNKIEPGSILMGKKEIPIERANLDRETQAEMLKVPYLGKGIDRCQIIYSSRGQQWFNQFMKYFQMACQSLSFKLNQQPMAGQVQNDSRPENWINQVNPQAELVIFILPGAKKKGKFYDEIKKAIINNIGVPSQVILESTVKNEKGLRVVCNKLLVQIAAKTQGVPYGISPVPDNFSKNPTMTIGIDIFHKKSGKQSKSVLGFVASVDNYFGRYFSESRIVPSDQDITTFLQQIMKNAINAFGNANRCAPTRIVVYRDGLSKGQFSVAQDTEIPAIKGAIQGFGERTKNTNLIYVIVNKRVNAQFYLGNKGDSISQSQSASSGTLINGQVTDGDNDFYLVSQNVRQGVASPTHYHILHNDLENQKEQIIKDIQILTYKLCFLYYNMTGSIKVPAPTKYAHVLSNFIGDRFNPNNPDSLIKAHQNFLKLNVLYFI